VISSVCDPYSAFVSYLVLILVYSSSDDDGDDENTPPSAHPPSNGFIEHESALAPQLPRWVCST
jgi:hypothetical protein